MPPIDCTRDAAKTSWARKVCQRLGLAVLVESSPDTKILCLQRFIRLSAFGSSTLILASYLGALGFSNDLVGLFMTLTLVGDVFISLLLALVADKIGRRKILGLGAILMSGSGIVFAASENYWVLLTAAIFGVITPR